MEYPATVAGCVEEFLTFHSFALNCGDKAIGIGYLQRVKKCLVWSGLRLNESK